MSYTGFRHFLAGGRPQRRTLQKLLEWHLSGRAAGRGAGDVAPEDVEAAIRVLELYLNAGGRERLRPRRVREVSTRLFGAG
jgi:hypothetical protein